MKKTICLILLCTLCTLALVLCSCSQKKSETVSAVSGATEDEANYPAPVKENFVESDTESGMSYKMTLDQYTSEFNSMYISLGGSLGDYSYNKWKKTKTDSQNDGEYDYYYLDSGEITLTASVERDSLYLSNVGCGVETKFFNESENNQQKVMTICGIIAAVAGGYEVEDVPFFGNLYVDTFESEEHCFWYGNSIYLYDNGKSEDGDGTMLFRTMPASASIEEEWDLQDYKEYWLG